MFKASELYLANLNDMNCNAEMKIPGFSRYTIDFNGVIRSINYKNTGKTRELKPALDANGYLRTMLLNDFGEYETVKVHRLVMHTFFGISELEVNHIDGDKSNNHVLNLEYVNRKQNMNHAKENGLLKPMKGSLNGNSKLKEEDVKIIREQAKSKGRYYGRKELAERFGVSEAHIKDIVNSKTLWNHV